MGVVRLRRPVLLDLALALSRLARTPWTQRLTWL